jgi:hypothetical protein
MILERIIQIPDARYPDKDSLPPELLPRVKLRIVGQGPRSDLPAILTVEVEQISWREVKKIDVFSSIGPKKNGQEDKEYAPYDEKTLLYQFNGVTGGLELACAYIGSKFNDRTFRYNERIVDEWHPPKNRRQERKRKQNEQNTTVTKAYYYAEKVRKMLKAELNAYSIKIKEKDELEYFIRSLDNVCSYDKEKLKIK